MHCVPASLKGQYVIRFTVTSSRTTAEDITKDWAEIRCTATTIIHEYHAANAQVPTTRARARVPLAETRARNELFGSSLLLANSPMSPKIVNGSFAAMFDMDTDMVTECGFNFAHLRLGHKNSPGE